ncbi:MAG TPA: MurR/RpiR family transcriptional regulator [Acidobacteriaceae bacterium]
MPSNDLPTVPQQKTIGALLERIHEARREMIRPVFEHPRDYVLLNVRELGQKLQVDAATVSRTVAAMGFNSYRDFQRYLHQLSVAHSTALERMRNANTSPATLDGRVRETLRGAVHNLESICNSLDVERLAKLADRFYGARRIYVLGGDLAVSLGYFLHYQLMMLGFDVTLASSSGHVTHLMHYTTKADLVMAISFRRGLRQTVEGVLQARANGSYTVGLTDTSISPIARSVDEFLLVSIDIPHFGASYVAPMAMLDALLSAVANRKRSRTMKRLQQMEDDQKASYRWYPES